jgi:hypothetical protein
VSEDEVNKVETILGYLEYYFKRDAFPPQFMAGVIEEANEWLQELREALPNNESSKLATAPDAKPFNGKGIVTQSNLYKSFTPKEENK